MKPVFAALFVLVFSFNGVSRGGADSIRLNQLGFYPVSQKLAIVGGVFKLTPFYVVSMATGDTVFAGRVDAEIASKNSPLKTSLINFSGLQKEGRYKIVVEDLGDSYPFSISAKVLQPAATAALKGYYYQRSDMPLLEKYAGKWARPAGHPDTAILIHPSAATPARPLASTISTPGGWYDAGDYNKYIVNSGITMGTLLSAYEDFPGHFKALNTNIPESSYAVPDILNEVLYNLRWMLTMQDPNDGGVYNKTTNAEFDGMVMPGATTLPRYVVQKSTAAALDFAAVMAQASRIYAAYRKQLPGLSDSCLKAAVHAWSWVQKNPAVEYNQTSMNRMMYKPAINTGGYGDKNYSDEWFWASVELYLTTKDEAYYKLIARNVNEKLELPSWSNVFALGFYSLVRHEKTIPAVHGADIQLMKKAILGFADAYLENIIDNAFHTVMGQSRSDFNWGSNANAANQGVLLINAYLISKNSKYIDGAITNADYLLGRNATGYSFITGVGSKTPLNPHHRPSVADGIDEPIPGLLVGGPNAAMQDKCQYEFTDPERAYSDTDCSYASNEIAINWNAPLVYLLNGLEALQFDAGLSKKTAGK